MTYLEQLDVLSEAIFCFDKSPGSELNELIDENSVRNVYIYRKNLFFGAYNTLSSDFVSVQRHLEVENFRFLVRKYILESKIQSPNISNFSKNFIPFLEINSTLHQDELLVPLAKVDWLYSNGDCAGRNKCQVPSGLFEYWSKLLTSHDEPQACIDFAKQELIKVFEVDGERYLQKESDFL